MGLAGLRTLLSGASYTDVVTPLNSGDAVHDEAEYVGRAAGLD